MFVKQKTLNSIRIKGLFHIKVLEAGLEPARANAHRILSPACLPIPPLEQSWSERRDSNPRPRPWQGRALPTELLSQFISNNKISLKPYFLSIGAQI